jgi:hypothetical protein
MTWDKTTDAENKKRAAKRTDLIGTASFIGPFKVNRKA